MRIIRFKDERGNIRIGRDLGDGQANAMVGDLFSAKPTNEQVEVKQLLAPLDPVNVFCVGKNYAAHARESGSDVPDRPVIFMKPTTALTHPGDPIRLPAARVPEGEIDYEAELAVVIGKAAFNVSQADALDYVLGYTCGNDVSARWWQKHGSGGQWIKGKGFDTFLPLGPALVTADEVGDPQKLGIKTILNGAVMQDDHTSNMIFPVAEVIEFLSKDMTLAPGTVIMTGTPEGVGMARKPPVWLSEGDEVTIEIERIGALTNPVTQ